MIYPNFIYRWKMQKKILIGSGVSLLTVILLLSLLFFFFLKDTRTFTQGFAPPPEATILPSDPVADTQTSDTRPNIILINADDLGYGDLSSYGSKAIKTPNIDRLADEGVRFTDFYASNALCTPSRTGLLTGRYPQRVGMHWVLWMEDLPFVPKMLRKLGPVLRKVGGADIGAACEVKGLPEDEITIAEILKKGGYQTGAVGKWHQGDFRFLPEYHPKNHGFDYFYGMPWDHEEFPCPLYENEKMLIEEWKDRSDIHGILADGAAYFIKTAAKNKAPFFLYFAPPDPHIPLHPSPKFKGSSKAGDYGDVVQELDANIGQLMAELDKTGQADNTLILFTSDNGPWHHGSTGGQRGRKGQSFEGGFRVPLIARWPGKIPAGSVCREPAMNIDFLPTLASVAGLATPTDRIVDGKDITGLLTGRKTQSPHDALYFYHHAELEGMRTGKWKFYKEISTYTYPVPVDKWHFAKTFNGPWLYNLKTDPTESYPLNLHHPELVDKFIRTMDSWQEKMETDPKGFKGDRK